MPLRIGSAEVRARHARTARANVPDWYGSTRPRRATEAEREQVSPRRKCRAWPVANRTSLRSASYRRSRHETTRWRSVGLLCNVHGTPSEEYSCKGAAVRGRALLFSEDVIAVRASAPW